MISKITVGLLRIMARLFQFLIEPSSKARINFTYKQLNIIRVQWKLQLFIALSDRELRFQFQVCYFI